MGDWSFTKSAEKSLLLTESTTEYLLLFPAIYLRFSNRDEIIQAARNLPQIHHKRCQSIHICPGFELRCLLSRKPLILYSEKYMVRIYFFLLTHHNSWERKREDGADVQSIAPKPDTQCQDRFWISRHVLHVYLVGLGLKLVDLGTQKYWGIQENQKM